MRTQSVFWSQEKLDKVTESLLKGLSYSQVAKEMSKDYPNDVFTSEKIRHLKRHGRQYR